MRIFERVESEISVAEAGHFRGVELLVVLRLVFRLVLDLALFDNVSPLFAFLEVLTKTPVFFRKFICFLE